MTCRNRVQNPWCYVKDSILTKDDGFNYMGVAIVAKEDMNDHSKHKCLPCRPDYEAYDYRVVLLNIMFWADSSIFRSFLDILGHLRSF